MSSNSTSKTTTSTNAQGKAEDAGKAPAPLTLPTAITDPAQLALLVRAPRWVDHRGEWTHNRPSGGVGVGVDVERGVITLARDLSPAEKGEGQPLPDHMKAPASMIDRKARQVRVDIPLASLGVSNPKDAAGLTSLICALLDAGKIGGVDLIQRQKDREEAERKQREALAKQIPAALSAIFASIVKGPNHARYAANAGLCTDATGAGVPIVLQAQTAAEMGIDVPGEVVAKGREALDALDDKAPARAGIAQALKIIEGIGAKGKATAKAAS